MTIREQIAQQALALSPEDRTYLADVLEQSLTTGEFATPEIAAEWPQKLTAALPRMIVAKQRASTPRRLWNASAFVLPRIGPGR
jgi:hypothetical protein